MAGIAWRKAAVPSAITARRRQHEDINPSGRVSCQRASHGERFIVRVGQDSHQSRIHRVVTVFLRNNDRQSAHCRLTFERLPVPARECRRRVVRTIDEIADRLLGR